MLRRAEACACVTLAVSLLALLSVARGALANPNPSSAASVVKEQHSKLAQLFDYDNYKKTFGKSYATHLEDSARRCFFYARALDAFVSGVNYKYRHADYYKALNEMSDWTPEERASAINKRRDGTHSALLEKPLAFMPAKGEDAEETLRKFLKEHAHEDPVYKDLLDQLERPAEATTSGGSQVSRRKREITTTTTSQEPRDFSFEQLIHSGGDAAQRRNKAAPVRVRSNNPNYEGIELETQGMSDQLEEVDLVYLKRVGEQQGNSLEEQLEKSLGWLESDGSKQVVAPARAGSRTKQSKGGAKGAGTGSGTDEVFLDHRESGCLSEVRRQGKCGCCYAFASIALAEWLYCKQTGRLVAFSEQYMVDCGREWIDGMEGCSQGTDQATVEFIHNFGLELAANYPYTGREGTCPYDDNADLSKTGYIRMALGGFVEIPMSVWARVLERTPMYIIIDADDAFLDYGGGVYDGSRCKKLVPGVEDDLVPVGEYHAMLLVGHGREDGQEYWLIRNSHGPNWGAQGYYKLSKEAWSCVPRQVAYAFGAGKLRPRKNRHYDETLVAEREKRRPKAAKKKSAGRKH